MANNENTEQQCDFDSSWSKYQLMVLQQLGDHTEVLQTLNKAMTDHKQAAAVHLAEFAMWKTQINNSIIGVQESINSMGLDEKGLLSRINSLEQQLSTKEQLDIKSKNDWTVRNTIIVTASVLVNLFIQLFVNFIKK